MESEFLSQDKMLPKAGKQRVEGGTVILRRCLAGYKFGYGRLHAGYGNGKGKGEHGRRELIKPHAFRSKNAG